jgi:hypothetical protein
MRDSLREKGRFWTFLITVFHRFLCDQSDRANTTKRSAVIRRPRPPFTAATR